MDSLHEDPLQTNDERQCLIGRLRNRFAIVRNHNRRLLTNTSMPRTSDERLSQSVTDTSFEIPSLVEDVSKDTEKGKETVLYLAYGSNLSAETFQGSRKIKPLSQVNVVVPELALAFDLPGVPYAEPCFGNTRYRNVLKDLKLDETAPHIADSKYKKDRWKKGLVGVVYEVTKSDYAHIIATEGGGSGYQDVVVTCYPLPDDPNLGVPETPDGLEFRSHTLFAPPKGQRPDPSYAQPSPRYLKLITDGAAEHKLPYEYQEYLKNIGTYKVTTTKQRLGQFVFLGIWGPIFALIFGGGASLFRRKDGRYPPWFAKLASAIFRACWSSYDDFFRDVFGDGERTARQKDEPWSDESFPDEKRPLLPTSTCGPKEPKSEQHSLYS